MGCKMKMDCLIGSAFELDGMLYFVVYQSKKGTCVCDGEDDSIVLSYETVKRYVDSGDNWSLEVE